MKFKSIDSIYHKEKCGLKPNTVRKIDLNDERFLELISKGYNGFNENELIIEIVNADTGECFERFIEDITIWENLMIISWKHEGVQDGNN
jgi:hypothetical protein